ncbi:hypothetical protein G5V59_00215 [Nocardioides sp. W3-2-3]|uniref:hypothetical protein n=1 Tax=Nocardioides convexus TaxID=2712224 RepID=UPI0024186842|nr:hypothetical protein [Nocardioides convexus]NGZ99397.1 hypothetical protein [Nocardioides convexus]
MPTVEALTSANLPGVAITAPGIAEPPSYSRSSKAWSATWRMAAGIYVRGRDHAETQKLVRDWVAGIRMTVLTHRTLGGVARSLTWTGEEYGVRPARENARTLAAGAVAMTVTATIPEPTIGALPLVQSTPTSLSVQ